MEVASSLGYSYTYRTLREGLNRQVRRMTAAVGFPTLRLIRTAVGSLPLGELVPGDWRELGAPEIRAVWE